MSTLKFTCLPIDLIRKLYYIPITNSASGTNSMVSASFSVQLLAREVDMLRFFYCYQLSSFFPFAISISV